MMQLIRTIGFSFIIIVSGKSLQAQQKINYAAHHRDSSAKKSPLRQLQLQTYEDNLFGYTSDSDDEHFVDVTISLQAQLYPFDYLLKMFPKTRRPDLHLNVAFTGRFGQYLGTRYSSPVIEKRLNPVLFLQYNPKKYENIAFQLAYGHESNGQVLDDSVSFFKTAALAHNTVDQTIDRISRGWDYVGFGILSDFFPDHWPNLVFETNLAFKYYLDKGFLQGNKEEYYAWERAWSGADYTRNDVSGLQFSFTCYIDSFFINKIRISYETGMTRTFYANSVKVLLGFNIGKLPLALTYRYGYNGDLAQYGKLNHSFGVAYILSSFNRPRDRTKAYTSIGSL